MTGISNYGNYSFRALRSPQANSVPGSGSAGSTDGTGSVGSTSGAEQEVDPREIRFEELEKIYNEWNRLRRNVIDLESAIQKAKDNKSDILADALQKLYDKAKKELEKYEKAHKSELDEYQQLGRELGKKDSWGMTFGTRYAVFDEEAAMSTYSE